MMEKVGLLRLVKEVDPTTDYWLIRSQGGDYFDSFYRHNFIALGWNYITLHDIKHTSESDVKAKIAKHENLDPNSRGDKTKISFIYNKIKRFISLSQGDVILIPSSSTDSIAFGKIDSSEVRIAESGEQDCPFTLRRNVKWSRIESVYKLDNAFLQLKNHRHAINRINYLSSYIDKIVNNLFVKNDRVHYVIDINSRDEINLRALINLMSGVYDLAKTINEYKELGEPIDSSSIRLNLQSPGKIEFIVAGGVALVLLAAVIAKSFSPSQFDDVMTPEEIRTIEDISHRNSTRILQIQDTMRAIEADIDRMAHPIN